MTLFPILQPQLQATAELPLYRDIGWDYDHNRPLWRNGRPVMVEGAAAVLSWAYRTLLTPRYLYEIYTWAYGNAAIGLIGTDYTEELKQSEAARHIRECLERNPYIQTVRQIAVSFADGLLSINLTIISTYGEVTLSAVATV